MVGRKLKHTVFKVLKTHEVVYYLKKKCDIKKCGKKNMIS